MSLIQQHIFVSDHHARSDYVKQKLTTHKFCPVVYNKVTLTLDSCGFESAVTESKICTCMLTVLNKMCNNIIIGLLKMIHYQNK